MKPMKILFIGAANNIHCARWVNSLSAKGHEVHLAYVKNHKPTIHKISNAVKLHELSIPTPLGYYLNSPKLSSLYKKIAPDVCNAHYISGYGTLAVRAKVKPLLLSVWGRDIYDVPYESEFKRKTIIKNLEKSDKIASTSNVMAKQIRKVMGNQNVDIPITYFGVDTNLFSYGTINNGEDTNEIVIGIVKTLRPKYGIGYLLKSMRLVVDKLHQNGSTKKVSLKIYGEGPDKDLFMSLCTQLNLDDFVEFCGSVPNDKVPDVMRKMHIFALSSVLDSESFGVAAVEAMSTGLPIVATDVDGFREVIEDDETGFIVKREDPEAMSDKLIKLIENPTLRLEMGKKGRARVEQLYDWNDNVNTMEKILIRLSARR